MKNRFYLSCLRDNVGGNVAFHGKKGHSYVTDLDLAEVYTREEAQAKWDRLRDFDVPISADHADDSSVLRVDMQYIPNKSQVTDKKESYAAFKKGSYCGNDVYWLVGDTGGANLDFDLAKKLDYETAIKLNEQYWVVIPYELANAKKRRTFSYSLYNARTMTQGAGIKKPEHIKRNSRRKANPKTAFNCTGCGQRIWSLNPYEYDFSDPICSRCE